MTQPQPQPRNRDGHDDEKAMREIGGDAVDRQVRAWEAREKEERTRAREASEARERSTERERATRPSYIRYRLVQTAIVIALAGTAVELGPENPILGWILLVIALMTGFSDPEHPEHPKHPKNSNSKTPEPPEPRKNQAACGVHR